jgi:predicted membrane protein
LLKIETMDNSEWNERIEERKARFEEKARRIEERWERRARHRGYDHRGGRAWTGLFLLLIGGLLLARQAGVYFPAWVFTWPMFLVGLGLLIGVRHRFRGFGWAIPLMIGGIYLAEMISAHTSLRQYIWPVVLIILGLYFVFRPRRRSWDKDKYTLPNANNAVPQESETFEDDRADRLDVTAVFGGVKKNILTKTFRGGEIMTFMGGAEINLAQADFEGRIKIDCTNIFGGTKLIIPPDWEIQSDIVAIFGGVDDKRPPASDPAHNKIIVLDGTCLFGGVEIRSYY